VVLSRELKKFFRERSRLFSTIARPLIWLALVGGGMSRFVPVEGGINYLQFFFPGILAMAVLFGSIFSAISIIWDKEFGYMKEMLVAPVSRTSIVIGKALSGTTTSSIQAILLLLLVPVIGLHPSLENIIAAGLVSVLVAFTISTIGILIATFYSSFESFSVIMNFIVMPMFFLSGAMYPVKKLPSLLKPLVFLNPLSYGVDALKHCLLPLGGEMPLGLDLMVLFGVGVSFTYLGTMAFNRRV
ncbi:MAG: ABC transporter, partial [Nitrospirae bacterium]